MCTYSFELGPVIQEMLFIDISHLAANETSFKYISYLESSHYVQQSRAICAILVKYIMMNNSVKLFRIWTSFSGGNVVLRHFLSRALAVQHCGTICANLVVYIMRNNSLKLF